MPYVDCIPFPHMTTTMVHDPHLEKKVTECMAVNPVQFLLDCSTLHPVIKAVQKLGESVLHKLFKLSRNYCHRLHVTRTKLLIESGPGGLGHSMKPKETYRTEC